MSAERFDRAECFARIANGFVRSGVSLEQLKNDETHPGIIRAVRRRRENGTGIGITADEMEKCLEFAESGNDHLDPTLRSMGRLQEGVAEAEVG